MTQLDELVRVHPPNRCGGEVCVIHNPTDHPMREWPIVMRETLILRVCPHGNKHPDPDSLSYFVNQWESIGLSADRWRGHTCDGCCGMEDVPEPCKYLTRNAVQCLQCGIVLESLHRHDYRTCDCPNMTMVDGGLDYKRWGGTDMSLVKPLYEYETD